MNWTPRRDVLRAKRQVIGIGTTCKECRIMLTDGLTVVVKKPRKEKVRKVRKAEEKVEKPERKEEVKAKVAKEVGNQEVNSKEVGSKEVGNKEVNNKEVGNKEVGSRKEEKNRDGEPANGCLCSLRPGPAPQENRRLSSSRLKS